MSHIEVRLTDVGLVNTTDVASTDPFQLVKGQLQLVAMVIVSYD